MNFQGKKLFKSRNKMLAGICGGIAEYLDMDPTVVRLLWIALSATSIGIVLYVVACVIVPEKPFEM